MWVDIIIGAAVGGIGGLIGAFLVKIFKPQNPQTIYAVCIGGAIACSRLVIASTDLKNEITQLLPQSKWEKVAVETGIVDTVQSPKAKALFAKWGVNRREGSKILSSRGLKRLSYDDLIKWNDYRIDLATKDTSLCSGFWSGQISERKFMTLVEAWDEKDFKGFMAVSAKAAKLELEDYPYPTPTQKEIETAMESLLKKYPNHAGRFTKNLNQGLSLPPSESCWTFQLWARAAKELKQPYSETLLRTMLIDE